jgi:hypothetical protein
MIRRLGIAMLLLLLGAASASAQSPPPADIPEAAKAIAGAWEISDPSRERRCSVTFSLDAAPGGFKIELAAGCLEAFASLGAVAAWTLGPGNTVRLIDAAGAPITEFTEVESGMYESDRRADGLLFLQTQAALKIETRTADQIFGEYHLLREVDKPLCRLSLSSDPAGNDAYKIVVRPGCSAAIAGFGLENWRLDRDQLVLVGRSGMWRFAESDATIWERVPLSTNPILLVRQ